MPYDSYDKKVRKKFEKKNIFLAAILDFGPNFMLSSGSKI